MKEPTHQALHPFGQIPTYEEGDLVLFETGGSCSISPSAMRACCRTMPMPGHARSHGCLPRSTQWSRRSLNSETPGFWRATSLGVRSACLWSRIASAPGWTNFPVVWVMPTDGAFSAGDLTMVSALLRLKSSGILDEYPNLAAYVARGEARPAYKRAFAAQLAINTGKPPAG